MKMIKRTWTALFLSLVLALSLTACGGNSTGGNTSASPVGTYSLKSISADGISMDLEQLKENMIQSGMDTEMNLTMELKEDGSFTIDMSGFNDALSQEGTWQETGSGLELTTGGDTTTVTSKDGTLTIEEGGTTLVFEKQ